MPLNITVLDQSPTVSYSPSREGESSSSWQSTWTGSSDSSYDSSHAQTNIPQGTSSHVTSLVGATVEIEFIGTAISLYGQGTRGAYTTTLDGGNAIPGSPSGSMLATYGGLSDAKHTIMLKVTQSQTLGFSYSTFTVRSDITPTSVVNSTEIAVTSGSTNSFFSTTGSGFNNQRSDQGYTRIDTRSAGSQFSFSCSNTSALFIYGTTNYDHQTFSVELDSGTSQGTRILNGTSKWFVLDNLLFWKAGMDPTQQYEVKITNLVDGSYTDLHSAVMMRLPANAGVSASGSQSSSTGSPFVSASHSVGKTVGIVVGVVVPIAAILLCAFILQLRYNCKKKARTLEEIDPSYHKDTSLLDSGHSMAHPDSSNQGTYGALPTSATNSVHDHSAPYPAFSDPVLDGFSDSRAPQPYTTGSTSSAAGESTRLVPHMAPHRKARKLNKGPILDDTVSTHALRQEVDAGRAADADALIEAVPPSYDPAWAE